MSNAKHAEVQARQSLKRLSGAFQAALKAPGREKSIHDLRVSIRRFKQVLRVYSAHFERIGRMKRALGGVMDLCGAARNCDVALEVLEAAGVPAPQDLKRDLKKRRSGATRDLAHELKHWRGRALLRRWSKWLTPERDKAPAEEEPAKPASQEFSTEFLKTGAAAAAAETGFRQMHEFRLLVKKTRYAAEILGGAASHIEILRALQDRLGAINDCVTTSDLIADLKLKAVEQRRIKAALNRLAEKRAAEFRIYWREHFAARKAAPRRAK